MLPPVVVPSSLGRLPVPIGDWPQHDCAERSLFLNDGLCVSAEMQRGQGHGVDGRLSVVGPTESETSMAF